VRVVRVRVVRVRVAVVTWYRVPFNVPSNTAGHSRLVHKLTDNRGLSGRVFLKGHILGEGQVVQDCNDMDASRVVSTFVRSLVGWFGGWAWCSFARTGCSFSPNPSTRTAPTLCTARDTALIISLHFSIFVAMCAPHHGSVLFSRSSAPEFVARFREIVRALLSSSLFP
jgi:hypothetical protein